MHASFHTRLSHFRARAFGANAVHDMDEGGLWWASKVDDPEEVDEDVDEPTGGHGSSTG